MSPARVRGHSDGLLREGQQVVFEVGGVTAGTGHHCGDDDPECGTGSGWWVGMRRISFFTVGKVVGAWGDRVSNGSNVYDSAFIRARTIVAGGWDTRSFW